MEPKPASILLQTPSEKPQRKRRKPEYLEQEYTRTGSVAGQKRAKKALQKSRALNAVFKREEEVQKLFELFDQIAKASKGVDAQIIELRRRLTMEGLSESNKLTKDSNAGGE